MTTMMTTTMNARLAISHASERCELRCAVRLALCHRRSAVVPAPLSAQRAVVDLAASPDTAAADTIHTHTHLRLHQNANDDHE